MVCKRVRIGDGRGMGPCRPGQTLMVLERGCPRRFGLRLSWVGVGFQRAADNACPVSALPPFRQGAGSRGGRFPSGGWRGLILRCPRRLRGPLFQPSGECREPSPRGRRGQRAVLFHGNGFFCSRRAFSSLGRGRGRRTPRARACRPHLALLPAFVFGPWPGAQPSPVIARSRQRSATVAGLDLKKKARRKP